MGITRISEVDTLDGVGHGTALAGRYRLEERLQSSPTSAFWRAVDQTLDRAVGVRVLTGGTAEETLDAARRAAMVEDPRLLRVLDVGTQSQDGRAALTYVVSEYVDGVSLADLLADGPLPAAQVRAMVGEAARGLEHARSAGLHHRRIGPTSLLRTPDGSVKVAGLAVDAAAEGIEDLPPDDAAREDAVALVALLYAGLTGRWPFGGRDHLLAAPEVSGRPAPPADVVGGVPNDLDTLCSVTFGPHDDGPLTPGELADQLEPWGHGGGSTGDGAGSTGHGAGSKGHGAGSKGHGVGSKGDGAALVAGGARAGGSGGRRPTGSGDDTRAMRPPGRFPGRLTAAAAPTQAPTPTTFTKPPQNQPPHNQPPRNQPPQRPAAQPPHADRSGVAKGAGVGAGVGARAGAGAAAAGGWPDALGARTTDAAGDDAEDDDADGRRQSRIVLAVVAVLVVVGLVAAVNSLASIGDGSPAAAPSGTPAAPPAPAPSPTEPAAPPAETAAPAAPVPTVVGVRPFDPGGDGENDDAAPRAVDDDPASFWNSSTYSTAAFGGLKDGLGMVVALNGPSTVSGVTIAANGGGGQVELRTTPDQGFDGSQVVASGAGSGGAVDLVPATPVETEYLLLWWTELPETDSGFRIELAQVQVR